MNLYKHHITSIPHPLMPGMRVVGFVVSQEATLNPFDELAQLVGPHPDTERLDHLLMHDHAVLAPQGAENQPAVESIHFIYDACPGATKGAGLRAAIDSSMAAHKKRKPNVIFYTGARDFLRESDCDRRFIAIDLDNIAA